MLNINFDKKTTQLIASSKQMQKNVTLFIEENSNVNPIQEEIEEAERHITASISAATKSIEAGLLKGPYNEVHFELIKPYLSHSDIQNAYHLQFWNVFSFECTCIRDENKKHNPEFIYMQAVYNILASHDTYSSMDKI